MTHKLKIQPEYLYHLIAGGKKAEVRFNDRDYQVGDHLAFNLDDPMREKGTTSTRSAYFAITHVHSGLGMQPGYVVLSLGDAGNHE